VRSISPGAGQLSLTFQTHVRDTQKALYFLLFRAFATNPPPCLSAMSTEPVVEPPQGVSRLEEFEESDNRPPFILTLSELKLLGIAGVSCSSDVSCKEILIMLAETRSDSSLTVSCLNVVDLSDIISWTFLSL
jgi:hypothetical protein